LSLPRPQGSAVVASILPSISHGHGSFRTMSCLNIINCTPVVESELIGRGQQMKV
jgi:hypothetical protein